MDCLELVELMLKFCPDIDLMYKRPLLLAIGKGHRRVVERLLAEPQTDISKDGREELFALFGDVDNFDDLGAPCAFSEVLRLLLRLSCVKPHLLTVDGQHFSIQACAYRMSREFYRVLFGDARVNPCAEDVDGNTALYVAAQTGNAAAVEILLAFPQVQVRTI